MPAYRIRYQGPASFALQAATMLADSHGIALTSSEPPERQDGNVVALLLTVDATEEAVRDALAAVAAELPGDASMEIDE